MFGHRSRGEVKIVCGEALILRSAGALARHVAKHIASLCKQDSLAERSKALASGASPQGRGFEPHSCHILILRAKLGEMVNKTQLSHSYSAC